MLYSRLIPLAFLSCTCLLAVGEGRLGYGQETSPDVPNPLQPNPAAPSGQPPVADKALINDIEDSPQLLKYRQEVLFPKFIKLLTGAKLTGQFTVDGKPLNELTEESYEIRKVEKQPDGDGWVITSRIKYGKRDLTIPVPLDVKWAGDTPVMTLDNLTIPGFGTFAARVVLHKDKYAGTWQHDDVGGHLFGRIELAIAPE
jgi:hypothetical protein